MFVNRIKFVLSAVVVLSLALAFSPAAFAASPATANLTVTATVTNSCSVAPATLAFGAYTGTAVVTLTSSLVITCTTNYASVVISLGTGLTGGFANRIMTNGGSNLQYNLYADNQDTIVWGDASGTTQKVTAVGTTAGTSVPVYGKITANQSVTSGTYSDTVVASVAY